VICPVCANSGKRSTVRVVRTNNGKLAKDHFFDEAGAEHHHNPNFITTEFVCSNDHRFAERSSWECHCGFKACEAQILVDGKVVG
jgi:hypothetical protein